MNEPFPDVEQVVAAHLRDGIPGIPVHTSPRESSRTVPSPDGGSMHLCPRCDSRLWPRPGSFRQECYDEGGHEVQEDVETWDCAGCDYWEDR